MSKWSFGGHRQSFPSRFGLVVSDWHSKENGRYHVTVYGWCPVKHEPYISYLVRFWWEDTGGEPKEGWRGELESIQTGQKWQFSYLNDMVQFLQTQMEDNSSEISDQNGG